MEANQPADVRRMQALVELRDQLLALNAQLEYMRLMLRVRNAQPGSTPQG